MARDTQSAQRLLDAAIADHRAGRLDAAKAKYEQLLRADANHADALHLLGQIAFAQSRPDEAVALVTRAIASRRRVARYHDTLALMFNRLGRGAEAEAAARRALALERNDAGIYLNLGTALHRLDRLAEAEAALRRALDLSPDHPAALGNLGVVLLKAGKPAEAAPCFRRVVELDPSNAVAWANLAEAAHELDRRDESERAVRRALAIDPTHPPALMIRGLLLLEAGAVREAITYIKRASLLRPDEADYIGNLANAHLAAGDAETALATYDRRLAAAADDSRTLYNKSLCQMLLGDLDAGLDAYEARWGVPDIGCTWRGTDRPQWTVESPADARVLVWSEQGIGDHILHAGLVPELQRLGAAVTLACDPRLVAAAARSFAPATVIPLDAKPPPHDFHIPAGSLLRVLRARLGGAPTGRGWLRPDPARVAEFRARLAAQGEARWVGISWRSGRKVLGPHKSMPLPHWGQILRRPGVRFVNLQYGDTEAELADARAASGAQVHTIADLDRFNDIDGLAALIEALDLVITTSNVTAHVAGALGAPCWVAVQKVPLWYWGLAGEQSPYYPSARLFRQREVGQWTGVAERIAAALDDRFGSTP